MASWTGICRIKGENGDKDRVRITDGEVTHDEMTHADYKAGAFAPPYDELPWAEEAGEAPRPADAGDVKQQFTVDKGESNPGPAT